MEKGQQLDPAWGPYAQAAFTKGLTLTNAVLGPGHSPTRVDTLLRRLQHELDSMVNSVFGSLGGAGLACTEGCDQCCRSLHVSVSPFEVFGLVHRLKDTHSLNPLLEQRIMALAGVPIQRIMPPCPLLENGRCLVYSSRPLACRGCTSADAALCAAADDDHQVPRSTAHQLAAAAMAQGVMEALNSLGLPASSLELRLALPLALQDGQAEKRWLRGEDVFACLRTEH